MFLYLLPKRRTTRKAETNTPSPLRPIIYWLIFKVIGKRRSASRVSPILDVEQKQIEDRRYGDIETYIIHPISPLVVIMKYRM